jgi:hypothetical protein
MMRVERGRYIQWTISLIYVCTFLSTSAIAVPVNYFRLYLDAPAHLAEAIEMTEPVIIVQRDSTPLRAAEPEMISPQSLIFDGTHAVAAKRASGNAEEQMQRISRNLPHHGEKMYQIHNVGDLPMFRFGKR